MKQRLDLLLVARGLSESREKAQRVIMAGEVFVSGQRVDKAGTPIDDAAEIEVRGAMPYVSRGGYKLAAALDAFQIDVSGRVCADIGASTGGFSDVLLQRGASKVYAIDVGYGQLDWKIRKDSRVIVMERANIRYVESLPEPIQFACIDVSFISLKLVLPVVKRLLDGRRQTTDSGHSSTLHRPPSAVADVVALVKPQFEAGKGQVGKGGVVRDSQIHRSVLTETFDYCAKTDWSVCGLIASPIKGPAGNVEFLIHLDPTGFQNPSGLALIEPALEQASEL